MVRGRRRTVDGPFGAIRCGRAPPRSTGAGNALRGGSAACATAVAAARLKRANRNATLTLPGGELAIEWRERDDHVLMTGSAEFEFEGRFDPALFANVA